MDDANQRVAGLQAELSRLQAECTSLQEQLGRLHRAKTTMDLLAGVAHDLAAALTGVVWCSEAICRRLEAHDPELAEGVSDFVGAADFARQLARRLASISRQPDPQFGPCCFNEVMQESVALVETLRPPKAQLHVSYPEARVWIQASPEQLQQVLINLVANSFAALAPGGGQIWVEIATEPVSGETEPVSGETHADWVRLCVRDDGHGMDPETLRRAFEPFFTTKAGHEGTGLGLSLVRGIVEKHGGTVRAESSPGQGASVIVLLPVLANAPAPAATPSDW